MYKKHCKGNHNTKLHESSIHSIIHNESEVIRLEKRKNSKLLATAIVKVKNKRGAHHSMRAFIYKGSDDSFISESAAQLLVLKRTKHKISR